jgi:hypothetical protein
MKRASILLTTLLLTFAACKKDEAKKEEAPATEAKGGDRATGPGTGAGSAVTGQPPAIETAQGAGTGATGPVGEAQAKLDQAAAVLKEGEQLTPELYEQLILAHASCAIVEENIDPKCPAVAALQDAMNRSQALADLAGTGAALGRKLISHESPAVRIKAAGLMASFFGTETASQDAVVEAARKETDAGALRAMIRTVWNDGNKNPKVAELLLWAADHESPAVRKVAAIGLSSSWNRGMKGGAEKLAAIMEGDADPAVRQAACEYAGGLGDDTLIKTYEKLTRDTSDGALYGACFEGVLHMWASYPHFDTHSKKAYELTLKLLKKEPRTEHAPPWSAMGDFGYVAKAGEEWAKQAKFFKAADLRKALAAVIADPKANWMARSGAVEAIVALGASKGDLEKLKKGYAKPEGDDSHVVRALDEAIAAAK